ncbi:hypothetical protein Fmac_025305 [Flemingia macrophylla]|uniref:Uncharacterized protein n=1 Tax=Flemingia macrophylla TaxID=520843 RepID=A0ABD1LRU0_9FABA
MIEATLLLRVVTRTILPRAPQLRGVCKVFHWSLLSFQTSSKTSRNLLPVNFSFNLL